MIEGLLYLLPALLLALPLTFRRYPGEGTLVALARRIRRDRSRAPVALAPAQSIPLIVSRGGRLLATALAKRPPPPVPALI